ncbi:MAG TPA: hypothetical protein VFN49_06610 [Candidatus Aquilonibacter sp.]|nr:hypothetical protein [Candidatus Aquilonibacter sp.]
MRYAFVLLIAAVALVSCGGGGSSSGSSSGAVPAVPASVAPGLPTSSLTWTGSLGPWNSQNSGKLNAFAIDPRNPSVMYAGGGTGTEDGVTTDTGIFKTSDGGASWSAANAGLTDTTINSLIFDPQANALYAATETGGIFRSTDGANSWQQVSNVAGVRQIVQAGGTFFAASSVGILTSSDGTTWSISVPTQAAADTVAVSSGTIFAGLVNGAIVRAAISVPAATMHVFAALDAPPVIHAIVVDPQNAQSIYASMTGMVGGIYTDALMHSSDGGSTWSSVPIPATLRGAQAIAFSAVVPHRLYVAGTGLAYTDDARTFAIAQGYGDARTLTVLDGDRLAIGSDQGIALGSYGSNFSPVTARLAVNIVRSVAVHGSTLLVTMQDFAPARSSDGGATWQTLSVGSTENGVAYINPNAPNVCYILDNGISVSTDGCITFANQSVGGRIASTEPFATEANSPRTYVVTSNGLYVANDGVHFYPIACSVPGPVDIALDPRNPKHVYIASSSGGVAVWRSSDGGVTFSRSNVFAPPGPSYPNDAPVLAVDPVNGAIVAMTQTAIYRSTDGGATFTPLTQLQLPLARNAMRRVDPDARLAFGGTTGYNIGERAQFVTSASGPLLLLSTPSGLLASSDDATTTHSVVQNAISHEFEGIAVDGNRICAGTDGQGVVCSDTSKLAASRY